MSIISKVAVASGFSPRFTPVLSEAWRFAQRFESEFSTLHVAERTPEHEVLLEQSLKQLQIPRPAHTEWLEGEPVGALADAAARLEIDLLVAGALVKEVEVSGKHFLGKVARGLLQSSPCSLLLFTEPSLEVRRFSRIVMVTDFSRGSRTAFRAALKLAEIDNSECLHAVALRSPFSEERHAADGDTSSGEQLLEEFAALGEQSSVPVEPRVIDSNTGLGAADFASAIGADLLVVPTVGGVGSSLLPPYMDWVLQAIPCDLWLVKRPLNPGAEK
jgi:nucleotide-binding universal stress UspA family protein